MRGGEDVESGDDEVQIEMQDTKENEAGQKKDSESDSLMGGSESGDNDEWKGPSSPPDRRESELMEEVRPDLLSYQTLTYRQTTGNNETLNRPTIGALLYGKNVPGERALKPRAKTDLDRFMRDDDDSGSDTSVDDEIETDDENEAGVVEDEIDKTDGEKNAEIDPDSMRRFGMWDGVFARCLLQIFGVIMFLRLGWVIGRAGIGQATLVMLVSVVITAITTLSLSAICTNGEVQGGGAYFMISRALGPEFGGSIGILFGIANAVGVALYLLGFAETIVEQTKEAGFELVGEWDIVLWAIISLVVIFVLCLNGVSWVIKVQLILLAVLVAAILTAIIGMAIKPPTPKICFTGIKGEVFQENWGPTYTDKIEPCPKMRDQLDADENEEDFFTVLSIFFPAVTGIMAGANISGEIRNPSISIPWGTILSIGISTVVYMVLGWLMGSCLTVEALVTDSVIMARISAWPPLIYIGIYAATLSSAIASLVGAPRIFQAVAKDKLFKGMGFLAKGHGKNNEPFIGYVFSFVIAFVCILPGELNTIAPIITAFFILSYAMINYACFLGSYTKSPGWRPGFKYYNKWVSLFGFVVCMALMFIMNYIAAIISVFLGIFIYKYLEINRPSVNWGSARSAGKYYSALKSLRALDTVEYHTKTYRPQILVLAGAPEERLKMVRFVSKYFRKGRGYMAVGGVIVDDLNYLESETLDKTLSDWRERRNVKIQSKRKVLGFSDTVVAPSLREGVRALLQVCGVSQLRPNIACMGFKNDWYKCDRKNTDEYVNIIRDAFLLQCGVILMRNIEQFDMDKNNKPDEGNIDVWWLSDDGGLTLLIPYLMTLTQTWSKAKMRVMNVSTSGKLSSHQVVMSQLIDKFRIRADVVPVDLDTDRHGQLREPSDDIIKEYEAFFADNPEKVEKRSKRTNRHLLIADKVLEHSKNSLAVVMSIPVPDIKLDSYDYMSWLDCLSSNLPVTILMRGNQENVLTWEM